jgi:predicted CXXCH cytochrome family protein
MKKSATKKVILFMIAIVSVLMVAQIANAATIASTKHDLSATGWGSTELCIFCHVPHNAGSTKPLWSHASTGATFTLYSSPTFQGVPGQPADVSKACLSCHDGTIAIDSYKARTGTNTITGAALLGTDLSNDHPISFTYDAALVSSSGGLVIPASASLVVTGIPLFASKMECASCHSVHDNTNGSFLRVANTGSALCLKCHVK